MKSSEFCEKIRNNSNADLIKKGTEFNVYDSNNKQIGIVAVQRTMLVYVDMKEIPSDLLLGDYTFEEIKS